MDDLFDSAHSLEQQFIEEGATEGRRAGMRLGLEEGRHLGLQKGYEIGVEVGQYAGFVRALRALQQQQQQPQQQQQHEQQQQQQQPQQQQQSSIPARIERNLAAMEECLLQFPLYDPTDEGLHEVLEALRGKHKAICAALGRQQQPGAGEAGTAAQPQQDSLSF